MSKTVLIACASMKRDHKCKARDLYISPLFKRNLHYAWSLAPDKIFVLSAKYGLVGLDDQIEPYDLTLNRMAVSEIRKWASRVMEQLSQHADLQSDTFIFLAGEKYRKYLIPHLAHVEIPLKGLSFGRQLRELGIYERE